MSDQNGDLPAGWAKTTLGDVLEVEYGKGLPKRSRRPGGVTVYASAGAVGEHDEALAEGPVIVIGRKGAAGHVTVADGPVWVIDTAYFARVPKNINLRFVAYQLQAADLVELDQSTAIPSLSRDDLYRVELRLPPRPEQDRIVEALESQLATIEAGERDFDAAKSRLEAYVDALLHSALSGDLTDAGESWPTRPLGEVCDVSAGVGFPKHMQGRIEGELPFAKVRDISVAWARGDRYLRGAANYVDKDDLSRLRAKVLPSGSVVMAKIGEAVRLNRRAILAEPGLVDNNVMAWVPKTAELSPEFLYLFSRSVRLVEQTQATVIPSVRKSDVVQIKMPFPSRSAQDQTVSRLDEKLVAYKEVASTLSTVEKQVTSLRQAVLHQAVTGRLVRQNPSDDPALELLSRIQTERAEQTSSPGTRRTGRRSADQKTPSLVRMEEYP